MPQGSAGGANFFTAYCESLPTHIPAGVALQGFADDHFMHRSFKASSRPLEDLAISTLSTAFDNTQAWMTGMRLKLNSDKTEFIIFGYRSQLEKLTTKSIDLGGTTIPVTDTVRCLGTHLDCNLRLSTHVVTKCKAALINFRRIASIRKFLDASSCETLVLSLVMSHIDYSNSILYGLPEVLISKLQRVQNMCAKLVLNCSKYSSSKEALLALHWLPVRSRISYKIICTVHRCLYGVAPNYLKDKLKIKPVPIRTLRSAKDSEMLLDPPKLKRKTFAARSFSSAGPNLWNGLPTELRLNTNFLTFKRQLKTHLLSLCI